MVELVDSLELATNVEFLDLGVQVLDGRVLLISAKDQLGFLRPRSGVKAHWLAQPFNRVIETHYLQVPGTL